MCGHTDRLVCSARSARIRNVGQRPRAYCSKSAGLDCGVWGENGLYRAVIDLGERILRKLRPVLRRAAQRRGLLQPVGSTNPDRTMAYQLKHGQAVRCFGPPPARARKHRSNGPETNRALTINPDRPMGARLAERSISAIYLSSLQNVRYYWRVRTLLTKCEFPSAT